MNYALSMMVFRTNGCKGWVSVLLSIVVLCLCGVGGASCRSSKPAENRFAAVEIHGNTPGQIGKMTVEVFRENGYTLSQPGLRTMVFGKESSKLNNIAYGNWMGTPVWVQVHVSIVPIGETVFRLECNARLLRNSGEPIEEEIRMSHVSSGPYQKMLNEVARRLSRSQNS